METWTDFIRDEQDSEPTVRDVILIFKNDLTDYFCK